MRLAKYIIDKNGVLIYPLTQLNINNNAKHNIANNQITVVFYNGIITNSDGSISGTGVITSGLTGTIKIQARSDIDAIWSDIENGTLNIANDNMVYPSGIIQSLNIICTGITGCNYIGVILEGNI